MTLSLHCSSLNSPLNLVSLGYVYPDLHYRHHYFPRTHTAPHPLFCHHNGTVVTRRELTQALTNYTRDAQLPYWSHYNGHRIRCGGASSLASALVEDSVTRNIGRRKNKMPHYP